MDQPGFFDQRQLTQKSLPLEPSADIPPFKAPPAQSLPWPHKAILIVAAVCLVAMLLYPPWHYSLHVPYRIHREESAGYSAIFMPPRTRDSREGVGLDGGRLFLQVVALAVVAGLAFGYVESWKAKK